MIDGFALGNYTYQARSLHDVLRARCVTMFHRARRSRFQPQPKNDLPLSIIRLFLLLPYSLMRIGPFFLDLVVLFNIFPTFIPRFPHACDL